MPVKNISAVKGRLKLTVNTIEKKALQFINAVGADAGILSKSKAPLEYGTLHNSQAFDVRVVGTTITGTLSYNTNYAAALNNPENRRSGVLASSRNSLPGPYSMNGFGNANIFNTNVIGKASRSLSPAGTNGTWKPKPPALKKGPAWNPDAEPMFLEYGFESDEAIANREKLLRIMKL